MIPRTVQQIGMKKTYKRFYSTEHAEKLKTEIDSLINEQRFFEYKHQRVIGLTTMPKATPKLSQEIAESKPWTGEESIVDSSKRMLEDSIKPLKVTKQQRLSSARESVLDYTLNKEEGPSYKERLGLNHKPRRRIGAVGGKTSSGLSSGGWIESMASQEIENAMAKGDFKNISRGKEDLGLKEGLIESSRNPELDYTAYLMNNIIKKQGGAPPWIMKQQAIKERIANFRQQIHQRLQERLVHRIVAIAENDMVESMRLIKTEAHTRDPDWEENYQKFLEEAIKDINTQIRGYNLQAPSPARKGYLTVESEIENCYRTISNGIELEIAKYVGSLSVPKVDRATLHTSIPPLESSEKHYGIRQLIKDLFSK